MPARWRALAASPVSDRDEPAEFAPARGIAFDQPVYAMPCRDPQRGEDCQRHPHALGENRNHAAVAELAESTSEGGKDAGHA